MFITIQKKSSVATSISLQFYTISFFIHIKSVFRSCMFDLVSIKILLLRLFIR